MNTDVQAWLEEFLTITERSVPHWAHFDLWDPFDSGSRHHQLRFFAAVRLIVGDELPQFVSADLVTVDDTEQSTYTVHCLFEKVVLQVTRAAGEGYPNVSVVPRSDLVNLEVTNAPAQLIQSSDGERGPQFKATAVYPKFTLAIPGPGAQGHVYGSAEVLRGLVADLVARNR